MTDPQRARPILVVEDSDEDFEATSRAFKRAAVSVPLVRCVDGDDALDYLHGRGAYSANGAQRPSFVLLDLNMPATDGREVLAQIKLDERLCVVPVIVLTTSSNPRDIDVCYRTGANTYLIKPVNLSYFYEAINVLSQFWLHTAVLPE